VLRQVRRASWRFAVSLAAWLTIANVAIADPPTSPIGSFSTAKKHARDIVYADRPATFYCGCRYEPSMSGSGGQIDHDDCGYETRTNAARAARLEWEHIMPAHRFGDDRRCWTVGHASCEQNGTPFKGRRCCAHAGVDTAFRTMENDLHNLVPAVGEVNGDRSNHPFGLLDGESRLYGACDFELGEAKEERRGDVARPISAWRTPMGSSSQPRRPS